MIRFIAGVVVGIMIAGSIAYAQQVFNGQVFLNTLSNNERALYTFGYYDGFAVAAALRNNPTVLQRAGACFTQWSYGQVQAIIEKFIRDHPERWHEHIQSLASIATGTACGAVTP